jgi:hypothetical protein
MQTFSHAGVCRAVAPPFDEQLLSGIRLVGFHPFILLRCGDGVGAPSKLIPCLTQNEAGQFVDQIARLPSFGELKLLRAVERALQIEIYEAAELFFSWAKEPSAITETAYVGLATLDRPPLFYDYPAFEIGGREPPNSPEERIRLLVEVFEAYERTNGNDALRFQIIEALAFGLSRAMGSSGMFAQAAEIVDRALALRPYSIHLKTARHALRLKIEGELLPPRFEKFIGEDNGYLRSFICPLPFERFDIGPSGDVLVCCGHWLPTSIGNFIKEPVDSVLNSARAQKIRASVADGSYKYCNHLECGAMAQGSLATREQLSHARTRNAVATNNWRLDGVDEIMFAFDQSCNLSCPSCRTSRIVEKMSDSIEKVRAVEEKLVPLLPTVRVLHINPAGELLASKPSRKLLELISDERCPDLMLDIISNGTLFSEQEWSKFPGIHGKVRSIRISIDAASKETFEKLRRLGKYAEFVENMRFLGRLRASRAIPQLKFSFTYQLDNFREMRAFMDFCAEMNADYAIFERLQNIAFSHEEYKARAVHYPDHPLYPNFIDVIRDPVFRSHRAWHDFDYPGVENMASEDARARVLRCEGGGAGALEAPDR